MFTMVLRNQHTLYLFVESFISCFSAKLCFVDVLYVLICYCFLIQFGLVVFGCIFEKLYCNISMKTSFSCTMVQ